MMVLKWGSSGMVAPSSQSLAPNPLPTMQRTNRFTGEYPATLDGEGRIQLPLALRDEMNVRSSEFRLMANLEPDGSLCLREQEGWEAYVDDLRSRPTVSLRDRRTLLFLAANSAAVRCDKQGRIRIPDPLLAHAGIDRTKAGRKELVLVGNFDDLRVWHPDRWSAWGETALADFGPGIDALLQEGNDTREVDDREP